jgi:hypothetical protein
MIPANSTRRRLMNFIVRTVAGHRFVEGTPGQPIIERAADVSAVLETCFAEGVDRLLLYAENLPGHFFDLRSGEAGAILQKLRTYHVRLAVVRSPALPLNRRFAELMADEQRGRDFRLFDARAEAEEWLCFG